MRPNASLGVDWPRVFLWATVGLLASAAPFYLAWAWTHSFAPVRFFYDYPANVFFVVIAIIGCWLCWIAWLEFGPGDLLRPAWFLIAVAATWQAIGYIIAHWLAQATWLNPLRAYLLAGAPRRGATLYQIGLDVSGTLSMAFLAAGLAVVLVCYRRSGLVRRFVAWDWVVCGLVAAYALHVIYVVVRIQLHAHAVVTFTSVLDWMNDPLLALLVAEALLLRRGVLVMGWGLLGRCWGAVAAAVLLTAAGSALMWAVDFGLIRWPYFSVTWLIWYPAAAAFAACPAYQVQAFRVTQRRLELYRAARHTA